nr:MULTISPECIES: Rpn family recombination-promoting nuclease/putative transposase [Lactobacillus]
MDKRARYYMYKMMEDGFLHQGEGYGELTAVYVIFVLPFDPKGKGLKRYTFTYSAREDKFVELNDESEIIYLNSKGKKGSVSQGLEDFYSLMEGKNTTNSEFIKRIKKTMDNYRKTEEWSEHVMNTEQIKEMALAQGVEQGLEQGRREARIFDIRKIVKILKRMNQSDEQILQELKQDYSDDFSDEELEDFLK